jgi:hypothetical protein
VIKKYNCGVIDEAERLKLIFPTSCLILSFSQAPILPLLPCDLRGTSIRISIISSASFPDQNMSAAPEMQRPTEPSLIGKKLDNLDLEKGEDDIKQNEASNTKSSSVAPSLQGKPTRPLKTPIAEPVETAKPDPPVELTADQQAKYETLLNKVKSWTEIPSSQGKEGPITENEIMWLTQECLLRYLRATKWSTDEAAKRLLGTLTWRREYGVENLTADHVSPENETGKQIIFGFDIAARPCLYLNPGRQNTQPSSRQVQHLVFMLERVIELGPPGQETLSLLINFKSSKSRSNTAPGIGQGREVLNILQTHYPERLGRALIINGRRSDTSADSRY